MSDSRLDPLAVLGYEPAHQLMDTLVLGRRRGEAVDYLKAYFGPDPYTGFWFDRLDGGGARPEVANVITGSDLAALPLLGVALRSGDLVLNLLVERADELTALLVAIPADLPLHDARWEQLAPGSPADTLYWRLRECRGVGMTIASKLLARKCPHLIPVYDTLVHRLLGAPDSAWACIWAWLHGDRRRVDALVEFENQVRGIQDISLVRRLDVVLWMTATQDPGARR